MNFFQASSGCHVLSRYFMVGQVLSAYVRTCQLISS